MVQSYLINNKNPIITINDILSTVLLPIIALVLLSLIPAAVSGAMGPNLTITALSGEPFASPGFPYSSTVTISNSGDQTSGITSVSVFFRNASEPGDGITLATRGVDPIRHSEATTLEITGTVPGDIPSGLYNLYGYLHQTGWRNQDQQGRIARLKTDISIIHKDLPDQTILEEEIITRIFEMTNKNRRDEGIAGLTYDPALADIAAAYAEVLASTGRLSHTDRSGDGPSERAEAFGYQTTKEVEGGLRVGIAENLAYIGTGMVTGAGYVDPTSADAIAGAIVNGWMNSPGHRKNILDPLADRIGVGIYFNGEYYYAVQEFW